MGGWLSPLHRPDVRQVEMNPGLRGTMVRYAQTTTEIAIVKLRAGVAVAVKRSDYDQRAACAWHALIFFCSSLPLFPFYPLLPPFGFRKT